MEKMARCGRAGEKTVCRNIHTFLKRSNKLLPVRISHVHLWIRHSRKRPVPTLVKFPVLRFSDWVRCIFGYGGHFFLGGKSMNHLDEFGEKLEHFWQNFQKVENRLPIFQEESVNWSRVIPIAIHGDEGRGRQKQPVMVVSVQTIFPIHNGLTNMSGFLGCTHMYIMWFSFKVKTQRIDEHI